MSYDVDLEIDTGGPEPAWVWSRNHTSNTSRMWATAGCDLAEFDGKPASELAPVLGSAISVMEADPDRFRQMEPANRWGTYETTMEFLVAIYNACGEHPLTTVRVSR